MKDLFIWGEVHYNTHGSRVLADDLIEKYREAERAFRSHRRARATAFLSEGDAAFAVPLAVFRAPYPPIADFPRCASGG